MELILNRLNGFGKYQKIILFIVGLLSSLCACLTYTSVFVVAQQEIFCTYHNGSTVPIKSCDAWENLKKNPDLNSSYSCQFDNQYYEKTMVNEWGFQCNNIYLASFVPTIFMIGTFFTFIGGWMGDKYGRKMICLISLAIISLSSVIPEILITKFDLDINTKYFLYVTGQFFIGLFGYSLFYSMIILICEVTSQQYHTLVSTINLFIHVTGQPLLMIIYYISRDWHTINSFIGISSVSLFFVSLLVLPESPRFLITKKRYEECYKVLKRISQINNREDQLFSKEVFFKQIELNNNKTIDKQSNEDYFKDIQSLLNIKINTNASIHIEENNENDIKVPENESKSLGYFLLHPISNLILTLMMGCVWLGINLVFYGFAFGITSISEKFNPYLMFFCNGIAECIGYSLGYFNDMFSRKKMMISFLFSTGIFTILVTIIPHDVGHEITWRSILIILFTLMGKAMVSASVTSGYGYNYMMFPTSVRSTLFMVCSSFGKLAPLVAPQILLLQTLVWKPLPFIIFSICSILAGIIVSFMPDPSKIKFK